MVFHLCVWEPFRLVKKAEQKMKGGAKPSSLVGEIKVTTWERPCELPGKCEAVVFGVISPADPSTMRRALSAVDMSLSVDATKRPLKSTSKQQTSTRWPRCGRRPFDQSQKAGAV